MTSAAAPTKRSLPSSSSTPTAKRPRSSNASTSSSTHPEEDDDEMDDEQSAPIDETLLERKARKDARTIRNRESAQRSRNQRKAHLAWLEIRVVELEEENKRLRSGAGSTPPPASVRASTPTPRASTSSPSPLSDGMVSSLFPTLTSGGINLAAVAPPPPGIAAVETDIKPLVCEATSPPSAAEQLRAENAALRSRLNLLESLVKQVAAVSNLGTVEPAPTEPLQPQPTEAQEPLDWDSIFNSTTTFTPSLPSSTADPFLASQPSHQISPTLYSVPSSLPLASVDSAQQSSPESPLACHPAAVATPSVQTVWSLQRARTDSGLISGIPAAAKWDKALVTEKRLDGVARVLVALAKLRGWIPSSTSRAVSPTLWAAGRSKRNQRVDRRRMDGVALRRGGMRG